MLDERKLARLAGRVHQAMTRNRVDCIPELITVMSRLIDQIDRLKSERPRLEKCLAASLPAAADGFRVGVGRLLSEIDVDLQHCRQHAEAGQRDFPSMRDVYDELRQVADEFGDVQFDRADRNLVVSTESIELENVLLGPFEIRLGLDSLDQSRCEDVLRIVALEPNPAESDSDVTHPHVRSEGLCSGEASVPLLAALRDQRLCDALLIVRSVLETYNSDSPFVSLAAWNGTPCWECGYSGNDLAWCSVCERDFCDECMSHCRGCEQTHCFECLSDCTDCAESHCERCLKSCQRCEIDFCDECLDDGVCADCRETKEHADDKDQTTPVAKDEPVHAESIESETTAA